MERHFVDGVQVSATKRLMVVDVDNCISDDSHRIHHLPPAVRVYALDNPFLQGGVHKPRDELTDDDFHVYHMGCIYDAPRNLNQLWSNGVIDEYLMVTAMPQRYAKLRWWWFEQHIVPHMVKKIRLIMRPDGNHECSTVLKPYLLRRWFETCHRGADEVVLAIDDRQDILDAYSAQFNFPVKRVAINE